MSNFGHTRAGAGLPRGTPAGRRIDPGAPPAVVRALTDTTLDNRCSGQSHPQDIFFVERESVATTAREALAAPERDLYVVAHKDDYLLFMNPDIAASIQAGNRFAEERIFLRQHFSEDAVKCIYNSRATGYPAGDFGVRRV